MRFFLIAPFILGFSGPTFANNLLWPDASIAVPALIQEYIVAECTEYSGQSDEDRDTCIEGERLGYRATIMMLSNPEIGEVAAERYRACRAGLGAHGGRFHRRRAECIGLFFQIHWRFQTTQRASIPAVDSKIRIMAAGAQ